MLIIQLLCIRYYQLFSGWRNVYVPTCMYVRVCACVHSLSVGDVRALKQKPSPGFCLAGGFMQLSVLKKGRASLDFLYFRKTYFSFVFAHTPLPLNVYAHLLVSLAFTMKQSLILQVKMRGHRTLPLEARYVYTYSLHPPTSL